MNPGEKAEQADTHRPAFALTFTEGGPALAVSGEMDLTWQDALHAQLAAALQCVTAGGLLTVNLCGVPFLDSSTVHELVEAWKVLPDGARMRLVLIPGGQPRHTMRVTKLDRFFDIVECPGRAESKEQTT